MRFDLFHHKYWKIRTTCILVSVAVLCLSLCYPWPTPQNNSNKTQPRKYQTNKQTKTVKTTTKSKTETTRSFTVLSNWIFQQFLWMQNEQILTFSFMAVPACERKWRQEPRSGVWWPIAVDHVGGWQSLKVSRWLFLVITRLGLFCVWVGHCTAGGCIIINVGLFRGIVFKVMT